VHQFYGLEALLLEEFPHFIFFSTCTLQLKNSLLLILIIIITIYIKYKLQNRTFRTTNKKISVAEHSSAVICNFIAKTKHFNISTLYTRNSVYIATATFTVE